MTCLLDDRITLRLCPLCAKEELEKDNEPYWHVLHLLKGIEFCPKHQIPLRTIRESSASSLNRYITAKDLLSEQPELLNPVPENEETIRFAEQYLRLADAVGKILDADEVRTAVLRKWLKKAESLKTSRIINAVRNFGGEDFLKTVLAPQELSAHEEQIRRHGIMALEPMELAMLLSQQGYLKLKCKLYKS